MLSHAARLTRLAVAPLRGTSGKVTLKVTTAARAASICQYLEPFTSRAVPTSCCATPLLPVPDTAWCAHYMRVTPNCIISCGAEYLRKHSQEAYVLRDAHPQQLRACARRVPLQTATPGPTRAPCQVRRGGMSRCALGGKHVSTAARCGVAAGRCSSLPEEASRHPFVNSSGCCMFDRSGTSHKKAYRHLRSWRASAVQVT